MTDWSNPSPEEKQWLKRTKQMQLRVTQEVDNEQETDTEDTTEKQKIENHNLMRRLFS